MSKQQIFDLFYEKKKVTRAGGGTAKDKTTRRSPTLIEQQVALISLNNDPELVKYYHKLLDRDPNIAPPPRPA